MGLAISLGLATSRASTTLRRYLATLGFAATKKQVSIRQCKKLLDPIGQKWGMESNKYIWFGQKSHLPVARYPKLFLVQGETDCGNLPNNYSAAVLTEYDQSRKFYTKWYFLGNNLSISPLIDNWMGTMFWGLGTPGVGSTAWDR